MSVNVVCNWVMSEFGFVCLLRYCVECDKDWVGVLLGGMGGYIFGWLGGGGVWGKKGSKDDDVKVEWI